MSAARRPAPRHPWAVLWLWLAVPFLLLFAVVASLPVVFEETPADRADAASSLGPVAVALLAGAVLAAAAGWRLARRGRGGTAGPPAP